MRRAGALLIALTLLSSTGCLTSTQATRLQTDLDEARRQLFAVQQDAAATRAKVEEIDRRMAAPGEAAGNQAQMRSLMQSLLDQIQALGEELRVVKGKISALQQDLQASQSARPRPAAPSTGAAEATGKAGASSPGSQAAEEAYKTAYADYTRGNYDLASLGFEAFLRSWPAHALAPDAQYWIAECLYGRQRYAEAAEAFGSIPVRWPGCDRIAAALLKKGMSEIEAGQSARGVATLEDLIARAPASDEARIAADRLQQMGLRGSR